MVKSALGSYPFSLRVKSRFDPLIIELIKIEGRIIKFIDQENKAFKSETK